MIAMPYDYFLTGSLALAALSTSYAGLAVYVHFLCARHSRSWTPLIRAASRSKLRSIAAV